MVMPLCGTFSYVATVPGDHDVGGATEWETRLYSPIERSGDQLLDSRLVGWSPRLRISDYGSIEGGGPVSEHSQTVRPRVIASLFSLCASSMEDARLQEFSFKVDRVIVSRLQQGDDIHMIRTQTADLGLSVVRDGKLLLAVGAVTAVPLGDSVSATGCWGLAQQAEKVFQQYDPDFELRECPIRISVGGTTVVLQAGGRELGGYAVRAEHGFIRGLPGTYECAAIWKLGASPETAVIATSLLLQNP